VILVRWAEALGWRTAFVLAGLPGLVLALALAITVRETQRPVQQSAGSIAALRRLMAIPNIWASAIVASLCMTCLVVTQALLPLFLVRARGLTPVNMSLIMGAVGVGALVGGFLLPAASDRVGRKPVLIVAALLGGLPALVCFGAPGQVTSLFAVFGLFGAAGALLHIVISMIPGESADPADRVTAFGLVMGVAEILGGFVAPALTGFASDRVGLIAVPLVAGGSAVAAGVMSLLLVETAPRVAARRQTSLEPA
jgi:predicted MFS family arabinose efflux permease